MADPGIVAQAEAVLEPLALAANRAAWDANIDATEANEARLVAAEIAVSDALADRALFDAVVAARANGAGGLERRCLDVLHDALLPQQVPAELRRRIVELQASVETRFSAHRGVVGGREVTDNEIKDVLRGSDDVAERRVAWEASKTIGAAVADDVRELARLRNRAARELGRRDWFALAIETSEMEETRLFATLAEVDAVTRDPFGRWKQAVDEALAARFRCGAADLRPWHYADPFFQEVPVEGGVDLDHVFGGADLVALTRRTFDGLGLETGAILERSDLFPRSGKCQHAFCMDVDRAGDVRVLCNVVANADWMDTMLHELGHAVFSAGHDRSLPWLLRDCHLTTTEGVAMLMGRLATDPRWLERVAGISTAEAAALAPPLRGALAASHVVFARWVLVMTNFERLLYADPDGDLDTAWWELASRYQLLTPPEDRRKPDWAAKIHIACSPVYYHTYLYGAITAAQLAASLERDAGGLVDRTEAGTQLARTVFEPGLSLRWDELLRRATGEPLTARLYGAEIEAGLTR